MFTKGPAFRNLRTLAFRTFSEISRFCVGFTDSGDVTAWLCDTSLH